MLDLVFTDVAGPAASTAAAQWVVEALVTFGQDVRSLVPGVFDAYVRVLHPATEQPSGRPVRWAHVAEMNGRVAHALMQWHTVTGGWEFMHRACQPGLWDHEPREGSLPTDVGAALAAVLAAHTSTPDRCWFAVWEGFGGLPEQVRAAPRFEVPARAHHLFVGPVSAITEDVLDPFRQTANIWWPEDHSWCVATEIDLMSTYVGCSRACADDLLAGSAMEAYEVPPTAGIDWASDTINPTPPRP